MNFSSLPIVDYNKYYITLNELADSMKPGGWLHTSVMEIGIQAITMNLPATSRKVIMPLRIAVSSRPSFLKFFFIH